MFVQLEISSDPGSWSSMLYKDDLQAENKLGVIDKT